MRLVGDSIMRGQLTEFCARKPKTRKRFCIPGATLTDIAAAVEDVTSGAPSPTLYIVHAGTNDLQKTRSEDILEKYRRVIRRFKAKSRHVFISGILPRIEAENAF